MCQRVTKDEDRCDINSKYLKSIISITVLFLKKLTFSFVQLQVFTSHFGVWSQLSLRLCRSTWWWQPELPSDWSVLWGSAASSDNKFWKCHTHSVQLRWLPQLWWICSYISGECRQVQPLLVLTTNWKHYFKNNHNNNQHYKCSLMHKMKTA